MVRSDIGRFFQVTDMVCMGYLLARAPYPSLGVLVDSPRFCMGLVQLLHPDDLHGLSNEKLQIGVW